MIRAELLLDAKAEIVEGPCWHADGGRLVWVDIVAGRVHLLYPSTGSDRVVGVGQPVGAAVPAGGSSLALAVRDGFAILALDTASFELIAEVEKRPAVEPDERREVRLRGPASGPAHQPPAVRARRGRRP